MRPGIRTKFTLGVLLIIFLSGLATTVFVHTTMTRTLSKELQGRGMVITKNLAANAVEPVLTENLLALQHLLAGVMDAEEDVAYIYVTGPDGRLMIHTFQGGFPTDLLAANPVSGREPRVRLLDTDMGYIRDIGVPLLAGRGGEVHVGMSEAGIRGEVAGLTRTLAGLTLVLMAAGVVMSYLVGNLITRPISTLARGAEEVGRGNLDWRIEIGGNDEIGVLARTFNQMTANLKESMETVKDYSLRLEQKVEERTRELSLLQEINNMINAGRPQEEIFQTITEGLTSVYGYDVSAIYLLNRNGTHLVTRGYSADSELVKRAEELTGITPMGYAAPMLPGSTLTEVALQRKTIVTSDMVGLIKSHTEDPRLRALAGPLAKLIGIRYGIGLPLLAGDQVLGTIGVGSRNRLDETDAERLKKFAEQVGLAVGKVRMEERLKEYSETLEQKVEEKTKQLIHSEKLASLGQLAAGVAHEINNPLTTILLDAEAVRDTEMDEKGRKERLEEIISQADAAASIVKNLLEFSRQAEPEPMPLAVEDLVERALEVATPSLSSVKVRKRYQQDLPPVEGDPNQLLQVFLNIILNGAQAMPGGGTLDVAVEKAGDEVVVTISDTGVGIPEGKIDKIFDPFYTTKPVGEGTGLGLSICLGIVERHGGRIEVESVPGNGSVFKVRLPAGDARG